MMELSLLVPKKNRFGQSLIEVLASMTVILLVLMALIIAIVYSIKHSGASKNQALATKYAQEGMETVRSLRNTNPETFWIKDGAQPEEVIGEFHRQVTYNQITLNQKIEAIVVVWWVDNTGKHQAKQSSVFTRW